MRFNSHFRKRCNKKAYFEKTNRTKIIVNNTAQRNQINKASKNVFRENSSSDGNEPIPLDDRSDAVSKSEESMIDGGSPKDTSVDDFVVVNLMLGITVTISLIYLTK